MDWLLVDWFQVRSDLNKLLCLSISAPARLIHTFVITSSSLRTCRSLDHLRRIKDILYISFTSKCYYFCVGPMKQQHFLWSFLELSSEILFLKSKKYRAVQQTKWIMQWKSFHGYQFFFKWLQYIMRLKNGRICGCSFLAPLPRPPVWNQSKLSYTPSHTYLQDV